ncbi:MAG TPA: hypothetical protein VGY13_06910 [Solirubrobacteraceae bacterium]|nr:hypothetical protein [Solirubrobacteraceae bacterium]
MSDLVHHELDVPFVGHQRDRDVGAAQRVGGRVRQRRQALGDALGGRQPGGIADDLLDSPVLHPLAAQVRHEVALGPCRMARAAQAVDVRADRVGEVRAHLHLADAGLGLRVGDAKARAGGVVQAHVPELDVAQLARARAAVAEDLHDRPPADVAAPDLQAEALEVVADGRLGEPQLCGDLFGRAALAKELGDHRGAEPQLDRRELLGE